ncbi:MAG TPA: c-type cytochrome [Panacibacter sp.]|nr:c-type cytochrome [Panacibacter sp.]
MKKPILLLTAITGLFFACVHQVVIPGGNNGGIDTTGNGGGTGSDTLVCFEGEILPIFVSSCAYSPCHDSKSKEEGYVLDTWQNITKRGIVPGSSRKNSKIYQEIASGNMPPGTATDLTAAQVDLIGKWIEQGARNTSNCSSCDTAIFTYKAAIAGIMTTNCTGCHSGNNASGGIDLSTYTGVNATALNGSLVGAVTHAAGYVAMPPGGALSDCDIIQIKKWVAGGAKNN